MDTDTIDLQRFCDTETGRYSLGRPWLAGDGFVYATDGRCLIRVDSETAPDIGPPDGRVPHSCDEVTRDLPRVKRWNKFPEINECGECINGRLQEQCSHCAGDGTCVCECGDVHDCHNCDGDGWVDDGPCRKCTVQFRKRLLASHYLKKLKSLPDVKIGVANSDGDDLVFFKFDGGIAVLAPLAKE